MVQEIALSERAFQNIAPIIYSNRILGLAPFVFRKKNGRNVLEYSVTCVIYSFCFGLLLASLAILGVVNDLRTDEKKSIRMKKQSRIITSFDIFIVILLVLISISNSYMQRANFFRYLQCLSEIDAVLGAKIETKWQPIRILCLGFALTCSALIFDICVWNRIASGIEGNFATSNYLPFYFSYLVVIGYQLQYLLGANYIKSRTSDLLQTLKLENMVTIESLSYSRATTIVENRSVINVVNKTGNKKNVIDKLIENSKKIKTPLTRDCINKLLITYNNICKAAEYFNQSNGFVLLVVLISVVLHLIITPYFFVLEITGRRSGLFMSLQLVWIFVHLSRLLMIVEPCHRAHKEALNIKSAICELLAGNIDNSITQELKTFSINLLHQEVQFSACGLFKITRGLITAITGTITTYLVILLQFNKTQ